MGCLEKLAYEVILRNSSFDECRQYLKKNYRELYAVSPGYKIFDVHIIGVPPVSVALDGNIVIFPFTKPCHGTFLVRVESEYEAQRLRNGSKKL
ncbi:MAG: DUF1894 domain-containing protein [Methanomicrobium sp.]|nr:DUF1894 domain-containing protein [Methanomicrobium sp.]MDD4299033.1 DUF1894 domain-containing protein [Methanomicrobium sp.]